MDKDQCRGVRQQRSETPKSLFHDPTNNSINHTFTCSNHLASSCWICRSGHAASSFSNQFPDLHPSDHHQHHIEIHNHNLDPQALRQSKGNRPTGKRKKVTSRRSSIHIYRKQSYRDSLAVNLSILEESDDIQTQPQRVETDTRPNSSVVSLARFFVFPSPPTSPPRTPSHFLNMDAAARVAGIADTADPTADPSRDVELGGTRSIKGNQSRASLPLSHQRSFSTATGRLTRANSVHTNAALGDGPLPTTEESDTAWGPSHPCFPHLNPHVPLSSPLHDTTRIIRIKRDWLLVGDAAPTFSDTYPEVLDGYLSEDRFRVLITHLNTGLIRIFDTSRPRAWVDAALGLLTGWLWDDLGLTGAKRELATLESWLDTWNADNAATDGAQVIPLRRTAYLCLDIQIPDPQLAPEDADAMTVAGTDARSVGTSERFSLVNASGMKRQHGGDTEYGAYPIVPPIPGKYLDEAAGAQAVKVAGA